MVPTPPRPRRASQDEGEALRRELVRTQWNLNFLRGVYIRSQQSETIQAGELVERLTHGNFFTSWQRLRRLRSRIVALVRQPRAVLPAPMFYAEWLQQQMHTSPISSPHVSGNVLVVVIGEESPATRNAIEHQTLHSMDHQAFSSNATLTFANFSDFASGAHVIDQTEPDWICVLRSGDVLSPDALHALLTSAGTANEGIVFADEDRSSGTLRTTPQLRSSSVGPHTMWSYNSVGYPHLIHRNTWNELGGLDANLSSAALYDFFLRAASADVSFKHCNRVLLTRDVALESSADPATSDQIRALEQHWREVGVVGHASGGAVPGLVEWKIEATATPSVDILIPTRDRLELLTKCLTSIEEQTSYPNYRIIILDNDSVEPATLDFLQKTKHELVACPGPFNYSAIMNRGAATSTADILLTLNNDTVIIQNDWLTDIVGALLLDDVGVVGNKHVSPSGQVVHAGVIATPDISHVSYDSTPTFDVRYELASRDVLAVTGACTAIRRELWMSLGGMDESLAVEFNDIDLCLRVQEIGKYVVYLSNVEIIHAEKSSRGPSKSLDDTVHFYEHWDLLGENVDPFFSPNLDVSMGRVTCRIKVAPSDADGFFQHRN